ncbi:MAG: hypothetical protein AMK71_09240 [Nitrospira bacterium SG8_35_4]|nr:MAG: hypothetical protein AMK71_09240 [Nitrospira bacterium SG8_35_4]
MMKKIYISMVLFLSLAVPAVAAATGDVQVQGMVEGGVQGVDVNSKDSAKFQEFRDLDDGVLGALQLNLQKGSYFLQMDAVNPGSDDQAIGLKGGDYGKLTYKLYYDEMPHNYSFNAISFYRGIGTTRLLAPSDPLNDDAWETSTDTWSTFDYTVQHRKYGGEVKISLPSPFYITVGAERREQEGNRPYSIRENVEVPYPVSFETDNLNLKIGYLKKNMSASLSGYMSEFTNNNKFLYWEDPNPSGGSAANIPQNAVLDPDNEYYKLSGDFSWRGLPLKSTLALSASSATLENSVSAGEYNVNAATMAEFNSLNRTKFDGDINYTSFSMTAVSRPIEKLNTRLYYRYMEKENDSSRISYNATSGDNAKELLSYEKDTAGIEAGYRLPFRTKVDVGYEYMNTDRSTESSSYTNGTTTFYRYDTAESTTDDLLFVKLKNSYLDWLTAKIRYKHLERDVDFASIYNSSQHVTRFDATDKSVDEWKLGVEVYPLDRLDFGLEFTHQKTDYDDVRDSRTEDTRKKVYLDMAWHAARNATISSFVGLENVETDANRITNLDTSPVYAQTLEDNFWTFGVALNVPDIVKNLSLDISWQYQDSDGEVKFDNGLTNTSYEDINDSDDYTKKTLEAKAVYAINPNLSVTLSYLYERYTFSDIGYNNYQNILGSDYYSGLYANQNYEANVGYLLLTYKL